MAIDKVTSASITTDAVGPTQLNEAANYDFTGTVTGAGESNTPLVYAYASGTTTTVPTSTSTKISLATELVDSENLFADSRFTVTTAHLGKYWVHWQWSTNFSNDGKVLNPKIYKNGSQYLSNYGQVGSTYGSNQTVIGTVSMVVDLDTNGDYIEFYASHNHGDDRGTNGGGVTNCSIFKILS